MTSESPFRLGFFSYLQGNKPQAEIYAETLEIFAAAESYGFDTGWVAQHHFGHHGGLASPFVFFATLAERNPHIGVGTAIISLPLENPVRVAEDAATFEALYPGRLQLGVGTGFASPAVLTTFDRDGADRRALYDAGIGRLIDALAGKPVNDAGDVLNPPGNGLADRIWEAPSTLDRVEEAAQRGSGLLLSRIAIGAGSRPTPEVQVPLVDRYIEKLPVGVAPRLGFSRTVYPSRRPDIAYRDLSAGLEESLKNAAQSGQRPVSDDLPSLFRHHNIHHGSTDQVIESLRAEPLFPRITDLICQVQPGLPSLEQTLEAIELIATEVAPALGWRPARSLAVAVA
jgi:alkanesulfonate monooxygenase SsuD/methylene tetrahydromethanopterin reductase-like flavin-dependent oxidoreductase (luciferase family)